MKKKIFLFIFLMNLFILSGCANKGYGELVPPSDKTYIPVTHSTDIVVKQDVNPTVSLFLTLSDYEEESYRIDQKTWLRLEAYNFTMDRLWVDNGHYVKAGDLLVSFKSEELEKELASYEDKKEKDQLAIEHYKRLAELDNSYNYQSEIDSLNQDMVIADAYIADINALYEEVNVRADKDGIISYVNPYLYDNFAVIGEVLIKAYSSSENYFAETEEDIDIKEGDVVSIENDMTKYELVASEVTTDGKKTKIVFEPEENSRSVISEKDLTLTIQKPKLSGVLCVNASAVFEENGHSYVYLYNEDGSREAREVTVGDYIDDMIVIKSGLSEGDEVELWD